MKLNDTIEIILQQIQQPLWEHWYIKEKLGSGAYSCVYKVEAKRTARRTDVAALKIQPITSQGRVFVNDSDKRSYIERLKARTDSEAEIMLDLRRFPNIVFYEDEDVRELIIDGQFEGYYSLLRMELLTSVVELIHKRRFDFSQKNLIKLASDIGKGIAGAHSIGVIHRDIKPDNFFVDDYGTYKIGDFNVAKMSDSARTMAGTPGYIAPEVYRAKSDIDAVYTAQADIYSFGICLYRFMNDMLFPFEDMSDTDTAHSRRYKGEKFPPPRNADARFAEVIMKACEFSAENRYASIEDMLYDLEQLVRTAAPGKSRRERSNDPEMTILAEEPLHDVQPTPSELEKADADGGFITLGSYPEAAGGGRKPLRWRVLNVENGSALLVTENVIDAMNFSNEQRSLVWLSSDIRRFLNGEFFQDTFSEIEKKNILDSELMNYKNVVFRTNSGDKTTDKVFLLSVEECERFFTNDSDRCAKATDLARAKGVFTSSDGSAWWWLRTSGSNEQYAADVDYGGDVDSYGSDRLASVEGVRPALRLSLSFLKRDAAETISAMISDSVSVREGSILESVSVGDTVRFGEYYIDSKFKKQPLPWQVLDIKDGLALVITKDCIDARSFDPRSMALTWRQSELRRWLNGEFADKAFGSRTSSIAEVKLSPDTNSVFGTSGGIESKDKVFLLSLEEAQRYFPGNSSRTAKPATAAADKGLFIGDNGAVWWWLRSPGKDQKYAANVDYGGDIDFYGSDAQAVNGVRPALWVDINALRKM